MKKFWIWFLSIVSVIIVAIIMIYIFTSTILGYILTDTFGTKTTVNNTAITFKSVHIWGLHVHNPPKMKEPNALSIGHIHVKAPLSTYFSKDIQIEEITLDNLLLVVEILPGGKNITNWDVIINHINSSSSGKEDSNRNSTIKLLRINNLKVKVIKTDGSVDTTNIGNLTFKDLSTKKGDITSQIAKVIILKMIFNTKNIVKFPLQLTKDGYNQFFQKINKGKGFHVKIQ